MLRGTVSIFFVAFLVTACVGAVRLRPLPVDHPANPDAPEAPLQEPSGTLRAGPEGQLDAPVESPSKKHPMEHQHQQQHGSEGSSAAGSAMSDAVYSCPNHPEVKRSSSSRCPICGTSLTKEAAK
jgi:hypothetical protein